jgi:hypothetical protein
MIYFLLPTKNKNIMKVISVVQNDRDILESCLEEIHKEIKHYSKDDTVVFQIAIIYSEFSFIGNRIH